MTANESFDRRLAGWLGSEAQGRVADELSEVLLATRATRQRPGWASIERWLPVLASVRIAPARAPRAFWLVIAGLIIASAFAAALLAGPLARPARSHASNGLLVYPAMDRLWVAAPDGRSDRRLENTTGAAGAVTISPDGRYAAYLPAAGDRLLVADLRVDLTSSGPLESPDVRSIAIPGMGAFGTPAWSPGSDELVAVAADVTGDHLVIFRRDGSGTRVITISGLPAGTSLLHPVWSPDGASIAFFHTRPDAAGPELGLIHPDGSGYHVVDGLLVETGDGSTLAWSPDPSVSRLLFVSPTRQVAWYDVARDLRVPVRDGFWPSWSPTGDRIAYWDGGTVIATVASIEGAAVDDTRAFPAFEGACQDHPELARHALCGPVVWSPDGRRVIAQDVTGEALLSLLADGSGQPLVIDVSGPRIALGEDGIVAWQPLYNN